MGMDLYKYVINNKEEGTKNLIYIGKDLSNKELSYFENFEIKTFLSADMKKVNNISKEIFNEDLSEMFYDFSEHTNLNFILKPNNKLDNELKKETYFIDDVKEREAAEKYQEELVKSIQEDINKYSKVNEKINIDSGILYIVKEVPTVKEFYLSNSYEEVGHIRKPFRHRQTPPKNEDGVTTIYIDNTTGVDKEKLDIFFKKCNYNEDEAILSFTNKHDVKEDFLSCLSKEMYPYGEKLFPLKDNECICIDW